MRRAIVLSAIERSIATERDSAIECEGCGSAIECSPTCYVAAEAAHRAQLEGAVKSTMASYIRACVEYYTLRTATRAALDAAHRAAYLALEVEDAEERYWVTPAQRAEEVIWWLIGARGRAIGELPAERCPFDRAPRCGGAA